MLDLLESTDISLFHFLNYSLRNIVFDFLMPFLTDLNKQQTVLVILMALLLWMLIRGNYRIRLAAVVLVLTIIVSDQLNSSIIKYLFERQRPCQMLHNVRLLVSCGSGYSFPSSHAVNNFAGALVLSFFFPRAKWWFFSFAAIVAFSRVYVGVHFPSDIIGGSIIGMMCGGCVLLVILGLENLWYRFVYNKFSRKSS
jgi:undecaprenyl-diphosphatase